MSRTRRGANSKSTAFFARREDVSFKEHLEESQAEEAAEEEVTSDEAEEPVEVSDAQKAALEKFTKAQLKERAASLGLAVGGTKAELILRLTSEVS